MSIFLRMCIYPLDKAEKMFIILNRHFSMRGE